MSAPTPEHPVMKRVMNAAQVLCITFICWLGNNIGSSVNSFSSKLDSVVTSIAALSTEQMMQKREVGALTQLVGETVTRVNTQDKVLLRLTFQVEQLEKERAHGR
ncbi:hypothetical protein [Pseudomonas gingeri]|jgi:hypothetical protein|uniref:hypothetical protein n=1 Tax=Pseudomonas gingeri TaxID=117681 RepID=UPI00159FCB3A|nr:hypothetical protein [Pseudomonas gingeri]NWA11950.1 hypothetical protein [Pseudomonas gingeri]